MASTALKNGTKKAVDLELLKATYGELFELNVYISEYDVAVAYLKKPTRQVLGAVMSKISSDPMQANEILLRNCLIKEISDMRILDNDEVFISAINSLDGLVNVYKSDLKKI
jgi:hypothetical protein